jgi:ElaB/YqjD/DUF883 family membrane-anchored ribosome-binding protein
MSMRFASFEGQPSVSELVDRIFDVPARRTSPLRKAAEQALRDANPQLANLRKVPAGTPILVPEVPGVPVIGEDRPPATPWDDLLKDLTKTLATTRDSVESSLRREEEAFEQTTALLASREVRAAGRQDAELQAQIEEIAAAAKTRLEESKTRVEEQIQGLAALTEDLEELRGR